MGDDVPLTDEEPTPCVFGDPTCPCQDGDECHYVDLPGSPAMRPPPLTDEELAAIESRVAMATSTFFSSLPWMAEHVEDSAPGYYSGEVYGGHKGEHMVLRHELPPVADFVAAAPTDIIRLVAEVKRLRVALTEATEEMEDMIAYVPDYFREKWKYDEAFARAKRAVSSDG